MVPRGPFAETGQGPDRPSDRSPPAGGRTEEPLSTGRSGPSRVAPPGRPVRAAAATTGPGTRTALAHCAAPRPGVGSWAVAAGAGAGCPAVDGPYLCPLFAWLSTVR